MNLIFFALAILYFSLAFMNFAQGNTVAGSLWVTGAFIWIFSGVINT